MISETLVKIAREIMAVKIIDTNWLSVPQVLALIKTNLVKRHGKKSYVVEMIAMPDRLIKFLSKYPRVKVKLTPDFESSKEFLLPWMPENGSMFTSLNIQITGFTKTQLLDIMKSVHNGEGPWVGTPYIEFQGHEIPSRSELDEIPYSEAVLRFKARIV